MCCFVNIDHFQMVKTITTAPLNQYSGTAELSLKNNNDIKFPFHMLAFLIDPAVESNVECETFKSHGLAQSYIIYGI